MGALEPSLPPDWDRWSLDAKKAFLGALRAAQKPSWRSQARPEQLPPDGHWHTLAFIGGRGSGKTRSAAEVVAEILNGASGPIKGAVVAPSYGEARDKCIEGESGLLSALGTSRAEVEAKRSHRVKSWNRSLGQIVLNDGSELLVDGAEDGALSVQGENLAFAWCSEIGLWPRWKTAWEESIGFAVRKADARIVADGTPKRHMPARELVRQLIERAKTEPGVCVRRLRTGDNLENLSEAFIERVSRFEGTELGRQELEGELLDDVDGALWQRQWLEDDRRREAPKQRIVVVGVDPADGDASGDEQAIVVAGLGVDHHFYVHRSEGVRRTPTEWLTRAITLAFEYGAARIVIEKNHGGKALVELLEIVMRTLGRRIAYTQVHASDGKLTRAEPVAAVYEQHRVHHVGAHPELEDQLVTWTGAPRQKSPDRLDALVWAMADLMGRNWQGSATVEAGAVPYTTDRRVSGGAIPYTAGPDTEMLPALPASVV